MPSKNKSDEEFIIDMPKTSDKEESDFIAKTMEMKKKREKELPPEPLVKDIKEVHEDIKKEIEVRKIVESSEPQKQVVRSLDLLGKGFHYFVEIEHKITNDFFFGWLPSKIKKYIKLIIPFLLMAIVLRLPLDVPLEVKKTLALFVCISVMWAFESVSMIVTALMIPVLAVILGIIKDSNPFTSFSNPIIYLLLSGLIIAQAFRKHELDKLIAVKVLALSKGKVKRLLFYTMLITSLLGMWMSNTATIALLIPVILSISLEINNKTSRNYTSMLLLASGFAASIGGITTILGSNPNAITAALLQNVSNFTFLDWTQIAFPISIVLFITAYLTFVRIYNIKDEKIKITSLAHEARKTKLTYNQIKLLRIFIPTILLWLFGGKITAFLNFPIDFYRTEVIGLTAAILLFAFNVLEWDDVRRIPWEIFLLVGGGLTLGQIIIDTGSATLLAGKLFSFFSVIPVIFVIFIIVIMAMVLANFVNNSSTTIILVPVLLELSLFLGLNQKLIVMTAALATAIAPLTPLAMPSFSLIFGTGQVKRKEMIHTGFKVASVCAPVLALSIYITYLFGLI